MPEMNEDEIIEGIYSICAPLPECRKLRDRIVEALKEDLKWRELMPALRSYTVEQTREVKVTAISPIEAANLADRVFSSTKTPEDQINIKGPILERELNVREDY